VANFWRRSGRPDPGREGERGNSPASERRYDEVTEIIPAVTAEPAAAGTAPAGDSRYADPGDLSDGPAQPDLDELDEPNRPDQSENSAAEDPDDGRNPEAGARPDSDSDSGTQSGPAAAPAAGAPARPVDTRRRLDDQVAKVLASIGSIDAIELTILDAQGLTLAEDVRSPRALPGFDNSAVDGYALRAVDIGAAREDAPVVLPVVGDVIAGARSVSGMGPGLAMRIMTGAPMPAGADAVVRIEDTDRGVARVGIRVAAQSGTAVRRAGEDMPAGHLALGEGAALGPQQIGLLAAIGRDRVLVHPRPRVVVISTGNELVEVGQAPGFGQVSDANSYLLAAAARDAGAEAYRVGIVSDDHAELMDVLESQLLRADIIVTSGGVSMGTYDVVKEALSELGTVEFVQVAMQPGKPQGFGYLGAHKTPIFCLPGNPVSSLVSFEMFVRPAIRKLLGKRRVERATVPAVALDRIPGSPGTRLFRRGLLHREQDGTYSVSTVGGPGSHLIGALAASNCLIVIAEDLVEVVPGSRVPVIPLLLSQR
jgi:molybdopterin molybdotransferase